MSFDTTSVFTTLHLESYGYFSLFLEDCEPEYDLELSSNFSKLAFHRMLHLLASDHFGMVFEHHRNFFHPKDLVSGFFQLFQLCFHITQGHIPPQIACILGAAYLLTMTKPLRGVHPIVVGETYRLTSHALCFQFLETFTTHFSPHQFGVTTKCGCEVVIHGMKCTLDLHTNPVVL
jgi:hypothetical protein